MVSQHSLLSDQLTIITINLYKAGLVAFVVGLVLLFGYSYLITFFIVIASRGGLNLDFVYNSYFGVNLAAIVLIISGVVIFYKGRKERNAASAAKQS